MHTSIWTATSPEALQAQLEKALFVVHLFGGAVFMHVLVTLRDVEWRISQGRIACRWSLFNSAGCRILPLLSVTTTMGWLTSLDLGNTRSILFNISQTTELVTEIFSFMIITLGTASVWNSRQVTYIVETAFLALAGVIFSTMGDSSINGVAHISSMRLALMLGRLIFSGFLLGVAFFGMLNRRVQSVKEGLPPTRMKALCATLRDEGLHLYIVVFLAQIAPVVVYAMNIDPSGLLRLVVEYTSYVTLCVLDANFAGPPLITIFY
ncbi:hypothetical protein BDW22DRAFT_1186508 [Trametopsis cervina]|nr:hypothetical protein BDW22DRAFT_1186508 [Trametopsis cervina]